MEATKKGAVGLIKKFFNLTLAEAKEENLKLSTLDKQQLGSAIARAEGIPPEELAFEMIEY